MIADPVIETIDGFRVVRDDYLPGGSKMRYMLPLIAASNEHNIIYSSPAYGYAQIALAHVCKMLGKQAVVFVAKRKVPHPRTLAAKAAGALVYQVPHGYLSVVQAKAKAYQADHGGYIVPFGVNVPMAVNEFAKVARATGEMPTEVWSCAGSGTLTRGLQLAWPDAKFYAVRVGAVPDVGVATLFTAPEKYEQDAKNPPPFPSCSNYDAKVWQFLKEHATPGALFWNVGA